MTTKEALDQAIADYYRWLCGDSARTPGKILEALPAEVRLQFLEDVAKLEMVWALTSPLRASEVRPSPFTHSDN